MKTKWMIIPVIALTLGCSREIDTNVTYINGEFTLYATSGENDTRTVLQQDGRVFWSPSDCITVFYGNVPGMFTSTNTEPASSAEFTGSLGSFVIDGETEFRAIYPHSNDIVTPTDEGILSIGLPWEQTGVEGTFADDLFICVAKSKDVNLHFYNVCGGVKFSLARGDIKKVVFRGNNRETLAGRMAVEFDSNGIPQVTDMTGGKSSVTLLAPDGGTFKAGSFYYLVLVPQSLTKGYTMELWTDELVETVSSETSVTVRRSAWGVLKNLGTTSPTVEIPEAIDLGLSVKWASFNLGATKPEEYGDYYAWGETEPYYVSKDPLIWKEGKEEGYSWASYKWSMWSLGSGYIMTKYCSNPNYGSGFMDNKYVLDFEDDAAFVCLGDKWRIPTKRELDELRDECTWVWTTKNGINGWKGTGPNGNTVFFPAAGQFNNAGLSDYGWSGFLWTSSLDNTENRSDCSFALRFYSDSMDWNLYFYRSYGFPIRPVYGDSDTPVSSVSLNKTELELSHGESSTLVATVHPDNATNKKVSWSSSNEAVATVSSDGVVTGVAVGSAIITVRTSDGGKTAICSVTVKEDSPSLPVPEMVDLGLSVKWATCNLGASSPEEYGDYYAWGETEPYYGKEHAYDDPCVDWKEGKENGYHWSSYKWFMGSYDDGPYKSMTKYCNNSYWGYNDFTDNKTILDPEDDAAHVNLGGTWRMPTDAEWRELIANCTWEWTTVNGVNGRWVTGSNGNSIFLPAAGRRYNTYHNDAGSIGYFWSSSLHTVSPYLARDVEFYSGTVGRESGYRYAGHSVRPVSE